ncbi:hypothetical protein ACHQM5_028630 [Ranunculus cassubicifolius]
MLGSLDCMHWQWKNCPTQWAGMYRSRTKKCTIILEAVASYDTWIWHAFFGIPGSNNDVNVLNRSNLFYDLHRGISPPANYSICGRNYNIGYYLADGIYPKWSTLVRTIAKPKDAKERLFTKKKQESYRKDVERAFGVLQSRFAIVRGVARFWSKDTLHDVMAACIIMHNMIVEEERTSYINHFVFNEPPPILPVYESSSTVDTVDLRRDHENQSFARFLQSHRRSENRGEHFELRNRLVEHLWNWHGQSDE